MRKIIVPEKYNNKKINTFILDTFKNLSQNNLYKALRKKDIRVNNVKISENVTVYLNDEITIYITDDILFGKQITNINVVYEDNNIIIVNKPEGIAITESSSTTTTLTEIMKKKYRK